VETPKEVAKLFEELAQVQREQFGIIQAQQESIDTVTLGFLCTGVITGIRYPM